MLCLAVALGLSPEPGQVMSYPAIVALDRKGLALRLHVLVIRDKLAVALPVIRAEPVDVPILQLFPEPFPRFRRSVPTDKIDVPFSKSINSNPYPTVVFFSPT